MNNQELNKEFWIKVNTFFASLQHTGFVISFMMGCIKVLKNTFGGGAILFNNQPASVELEIIFAVLAPISMII